MCDTWWRRLQLVAKYVSISLFLFFIPLVSLMAQEENKGEAPPRAFDNITLGMSYDAVLSALAENTHFIYRGRPDVSMLDPIDRTTIEVRGAGFVYRGFFTFYNDALYTITIVIHQGKLDYFTLLQQLQKRYGAPHSITPEHSTWEDASTRLSLEYPATLKYIDLATFESLLNKNNSERSAIDKSREKFLEGL